VFRFSFPYYAHDGRQIVTHHNSSNAGAYQPTQTLQTNKGTTTSGDVDSATQTADPKETTTTRRGGGEATSTIKPLSTSGAADSVTHDHGHGVLAAAVAGVAAALL
jgi:hypothetical protein